MTSEPSGEQLRIPTEYGTPSRILSWPEVRAKLEEASNYWLATVRADGRPHVVPIDGLWMDDACWFGGSPEAVWQENMRTERRVVLHLPDPVAAVILEGTCEIVVPDAAGVDRLEQASKNKYGYAPPPGAYASGVWCLRPAKVMAWTALPADVTRFRFPANSTA